MYLLIIRAPPLAKEQVHTTLSSYHTSSILYTQKFKSTMTTETATLASKATVVKLLLSCLILAALLATHVRSNPRHAAVPPLQESHQADAAAPTNRMLRGGTIANANTNTNANRNLASTVLSVSGGGGSSKAGALASYVGNNMASGTGNGGGQGSSNSFSVGNIGVAYSTAGGNVINNSKANATSDNLTVSDANATSKNSFMGYGVALLYEDGAFGGYYGLGDAYGYGFGNGVGEGAAASKGSGFGGSYSYGAGLAMLGQVTALANGNNLAKGSGAGGGRKPSGYGSFGGGGGGGGDQYGGSFAAFGPRFNNSADGLPILPGALSALTRPPNRTDTTGNQPSGMTGGFEQTDP